MSIAFLHSDVEMVLCSLDTVSFTKKPTPADIRNGMNKRIPSGGTSVTPEQFRDAVLQGKSFAPALFEGSRSNENWRVQNIVCLDFDKEGSLDDFQLRCATLELQPFFVYHTFTSTDKRPKFRACFRLDGIIVCSRLRDLVADIFKYLFPSADHTFDAARLFFGTNQKTITFDACAVVPIEQLVLNFIDEVRVFDPSHATRKIASVFKRSGIAVNGKSASIHFHIPKVGSQSPLTGETMTRSTYIEPLCHEFTKDAIEVACISEVNHSNENTCNITPPPKPHSKRELDSSDIGILLDNCRLFGDFANAKKVSHFAKMTLLTNLIPFRGGEKLFFDYLDAGNANNGDDKPRRFRTHAKYVKHRQYHPWTCEKAKCPYITDCFRFGSKPLDQVERIRCGQIEVIPGRKRVLVPLSESQARVAETIDIAMKDRIPSIHVICADCGIGKTRALLGASDSPRDLRGCVIAVPTHRLIAEVKHRASQDLFVWPERPAITSGYSKALEHVDATGIGSTIPILRQYLDDDAANNDPILEFEVRDYIRAIEAVKSAESILCTHAKALLLDNPHVHTYIFDEDLISSILRVSRISSSDFNLLRDLVLHNPDYGALKEHIEITNGLGVGMAKYKTLQAPDEALLQNLAKVLGSQIQTRALGLFTAAATIKDKNSDILTLHKAELKADKKYIVLSATADREVYRSLYGDRVVFHDLRGTELRGRLVQHAQHSFSRQNIKNAKEDFEAVINDLTRKYGVDGVITFKKYLDAETGNLIGTKLPVIGTYGSVEGLDSSAGKKLAVIGTPHINPAQYALYACALSGASQDKPIKYVPRRVERNEYRFYVMTADNNPAITAIQLWEIEKNLVQAVGRARLLHHDCEVHLFSNFPLSGADFIK